MFKNNIIDIKVVPATSPCDGDLQTKYNKLSDDL